jgi:hypothetical protein
MALAPTQSLVETPSRAYYRQAMEILTRAEVPFLVGGAFAFVHQAGIDRSTKDLDLFVRPCDVHRLLEVCSAAGYEAELVFSHWLAKIRSGESFIDVIFSSGNGLAVVDERWFEHATQQNVLGLTVQVAPAEESLWSKAFVQERERFDGADVAHLLLARASDMDWQRLLRRFGPSWRVLFSHLVLFGFIYPSERERVPNWVMQELTRRLQSSLSAPAPGERICRGPLLSRQQYLFDIEQRGYVDARSLPENSMTDDDIATWTAGIARDGSHE